MVEPPPPKRTYTPHHVNVTNSNCVRTLCVVPNIIHNSVPIPVTDVCVFPAIKSDGVKHMCHHFPPPHVVLSAPLALEGFQSAQNMLHKGQFYSHRLQGADSKMTGVIFNSPLTGFQKVSSTTNIRPSGPLRPLEETRGPTAMVSNGPPVTAAASAHTSALAAVAPPLPISPLGRHLLAWKVCQPCPWVLRTIEHGYKLQFSRQPPLTSKVSHTLASGESLLTLREEVKTLLEKGAIQKVDLQKNPKGFYSNYFLVEKKGGGRGPYWT